MTKYLVYAESANYCGYGQHWVVDASSEDEARDKVEPHAEDYFYEQDSEHLEEDGLEEGPYATIESVEEFGPEHKDWKYYLDQGQSEHYITIE